MYEIIDFSNNLFVYLCNEIKKFKKDRVDLFSFGEAHTYRHISFRFIIIYLLLNYQRIDMIVESSYKIRFLTFLIRIVGLIVEKVSAGPVYPCSSSLLIYIDVKSLSIGRMNDRYSPQVCRIY